MSRPSSSVDLGRGRKLGKLGKLGNLGESVFRGFSLRGFHLQVFGFGIVQNGKLGVERPRKNIPRVFRELPVFDLTVDLGYQVSRNDLHRNPRFKTCAAA